VKVGGRARAWLSKLLASRPISFGIVVASRFWGGIRTAAGKIYGWILSMAKKFYHGLSRRVVRVWRWFKNYGSDTFLSIDCIAGLIVAVGLFIGGMLNKAIIPGIGVLVGEIAIGTAILSVALIALSILVAFMGEEYVKLLRESVGIDRAIMPYQTVAVVSALDMLAAILTILVWSIMPHWGRNLTTSVVAGLTTWAVIGTVQLVNITARHGRRRARMPEIRAAAREALEDRNEAS